MPYHLGGHKRRILDITWNWKNCCEISKKIVLKETPHNHRFQRVLSKGSINYKQSDDVRLTFIHEGEYYDGSRCFLNQNKYSIMKRKRPLLKRFCILNLTAYMYNYTE